MKKQIIALVIIVVAAAIGAYALLRYQRTQLNGEAPNSQANLNNALENANQANSPAAPQPADSVAVSTQTPGGEIVIDQVKLSEPGFIVIHEVTGGKPGKIIGSSKLLPSGTRQDVIIKAVVSANKSYAAMLHADDGDGKFDSAKDQPVLSGGQPVMAMFNVAK